MKLLLLLLPSFLFASFNGSITDAKTGTPVRNAQISDAYKTVYSDANGMFAIDTNASSVRIKGYGYRPAEANATLERADMALEPINVKALYLSFWGAKLSSKTAQRVLKLIDETEVNALVVDVKNEFGLTSYKTDVEHANAMGAFYNRTIKDMDAFMKAMKSRNVYLIARIVVFKDELKAKKHPYLALKSEDGTVWRNREKMAWVDPYLTQVHKYNLDIAEDAARIGFDEINFDYIRFPAKADLCFSEPHTQENRIKAIDRFLSAAKERLRPHGTFISVNTYGNVCWSDDDTNIGHTVATLARHADYVSPMLYPSGFGPGVMGFKDPTEHSYEIVSESIKRMHGDIEPVRVRPWLQAFKDYAYSRKHYKEERIAEQIKASIDTNTSGWMLWNPSSRYTYVRDAVCKVRQPSDSIDLIKESPFEAHYYKECALR